MSSADGVFDPYWEKDREGYFSKIDYANVASPSYVIDEGALEENLKILKRVKDESGALILLALKGYAAWQTFPLVSKYLDGVCASSVNEARLGREKFGKAVYTFAPAYDDRDIEEHLTYSDHIIFNSFSLWNKYKKIIQESGKPIDCGIRINPESSGAENDMYNPCAPGSRMGVTIAEFKKYAHDLDGISGLHFHALCEQNADALEDALKRVEENFGEYLPKMKWVNFGGGHHITRNDYDIEKLISLIKAFKEKYEVEVILEPGEAVGLNTGVLVATVLDIVENDGKIAILDTSAEAHVPDVLGMPYRPAVIGAAKKGEKAYDYKFGGITCLSGDFFGTYSFDRELHVGDRVVFLNMAIYTMVKNTTFNGIRMPDIVVMDATHTVTHTKKFGYEEYVSRLS